MVEVFLKILNMSIAASWMILAVLVLRMVMKRAPKWTSVLLWGLVALRLVVPCSLESVLSLIPSAETFDARNIQSGKPEIHSGVEVINSAVNPVLEAVFAPDTAESVSPLHVATAFASALWAAGIAVMLLYAAVSFLRVRRSVAERVPWRENIFLCDGVPSPFILGLFRPKIYLPSGMEDTAMEPVIAHEKAHLERGDHWWKPLGFLILALHWFNPLCWTAYMLLCRDIELACDEKVVAQLSMEGKKQYSTALLTCGIQRRSVAVCPLAFGEVGIKERVKNVLNYKKPTCLVLAVAVILCGITAVCFLTNPADGKTEEQDGYYLTVGADGVKEILVSTPYSSGGTMNADESPLKKGERMYLGHLDTLQNLSGVTIEALDENGNSVFLWSAPADAKDMTEFSADDWLLEHISREQPGQTEPSADTDASESADEQTATSTSSDGQAAIRQAILEHNQATYPLEYDAACCSFATLAVEQNSPTQSDGSSEVTYYGWALCEQYTVSEEGLECTGGSHVPVAITLAVNESGCTLQEYWEPRDGSLWESDIRANVPSGIVDGMMDSQACILSQTQECYVQAVTATNLDTVPVLEGLLATIMSNPVTSSNPRDYMEAHPIEYRELTYYGQYTLEYCFSRFEHGGETGLSGHIMMHVCEDIAAEWGEEPLVFFGIQPENGQQWYDAFRENALSLKEQYSAMELAEQYPASLLLLDMTGEL